VINLNKGLKMSNLSEEQLNYIYTRLQGTCQSMESLLEFLELNVDPEDIEIEMEIMNLEKCPFCGWWMESYELINDDGDIVGCEQCRDDEQDDL
jgi:hypothetical protein